MSKNVDDRDVFPLSKKVRAIRREVEDNPDLLGEIKRNPEMYLIDRGIDVDIAKNMVANDRGEIVSLDWCICTRCCCTRCCITSIKL